AHAMALPRPLDAERSLGLVRAGERAQLRRAAQRAVDEESVDHRIGEARWLGIAGDEFIRHRAAEPVAPALGTETQQMLAIALGLADPQLADGAAVDQVLVHSGLLTLLRLLKDPPDFLFPRPATEFIESLSQL